MGGMPDDYFPRLQFSLRRLLASMLVVAVGLGLVMMICLDRFPSMQPPWPILLLIAGCALTGTGVMNPFRLWWAGAILGLVAGIIGAAILLSMPTANGYYL
jgi:hypothetical protein